MIPIVPAIIPKDKAELDDLLLKLTFSPEIHIDVVDGIYVPFESWPYQPVGNPQEIKKYTDAYTLEVDLMVKDPLKAAEEWIKAGADMLVFHTDNCTKEDFKKFVSTTGPGVSVSIAATPDLQISDLRPYLDYADGIQLMGILKVGSQGQPFSELVLERIVEVKKAYPQLPVTVDGSVNHNTIPGLVRAGANRFICGSAIIKEADLYEAYTKLRELTNN